MFLGVLGCTFHTQSASFLSTAMHHSPPSGNPELRVCVIPTVVFSDFEVLIPFLANGFCHSLTSLTPASQPVSQPVKQSVTRRHPTTSQLPSQAVCHAIV